MERQKLGFLYEEYCKEKYGLSLHENYTDKWDGQLNGFPVSIKTAKINSDIEMADFFRNSRNKEDFYLLVGFWKDKKDNIIEEHLLKINGGEYNLLFNNKYETRLKELLQNISNDKSDDEKWRAEIKSIRNDWKNDTPNLIRLRFKRDHKSQKRIQCAINNKDFYNYFVPKYEVL